VTLRDDLQPTVDHARALVQDLGLRPHAVVIRTRTWSGGAPGATGASAVDVDVEISPRPRVRPPAPRLTFAEPGRYEEEDRVVDRISRTYSEAQLGPDTVAGVERFWLIDGERYRVVGKPELRSFEWRVQLRRMGAR
jgi:hypothetical protein